MKHLSIILIALVLALTTAGTLPAQVFADALPEYISEVKIYEGSYSTAKAEGFTILCGEDGKPVDLNQGSGSNNVGAKGDKAVYLGYKTTTDREDAITDLALMNMKGGYSVEEYDALMADQMKSQIVPLVDGFLAAINEYRENYNSDNEANRQRAMYIHDILDKMKDDDCGGAGLGELLLNKTVYEMAKPKCDALSAKDKETISLYDVNIQVRDSLPAGEKNKHADILTIIAQSNGKATLMIENLITRAADTGEDNWLDRFSGITYTDLAGLLDMLPTDAEAELARNYDSDAKKLLNMWDDLSKDLGNSAEAEKTVKGFNEDKYDEAFDALKEVTGEVTLDIAKKTLGDYADAQTDLYDAAYDAETLAIREKLAEYEYGNGTLLDFFSKPASEIKNDIKVLYPLIASLSDGQRAGLEFISLKELLVIAMTDENGYSDAELDEFEDISVYDGVDRGIYQKGGVALTSDTLRTKALSKTMEEDSLFSGWTIAAMVITGVTIAAFAASAVSWSKYAAKLGDITEKINTHKEVLFMQWGDKPGINVVRQEGLKFGGWNMNDVFAEGEHPEWRQVYEGATSGTSLSKGLTIGLGVAMVALALVTTYLTYSDMKAYYNVKFTPIPHYMVDEKDITVINESGDTIVIKNQSAYYKVVECNRKKGDDYFDIIDTCADMNGCVNPQWLALYAQKSDIASPILAGSFLVKVNDKNLPAGYKTGIHMFGSGSACNLNNENYCWNKSANSVMVYFKTQSTSGASTSGSNFTTGSLALAGVCGLAAGALISGIAATAIGKKKRKTAA
ncbi:MAG: hypothetical protein J5562_01985 [Clostridia bacterium]|nr:hypothetical protein [Clostridia bacterium]